MHGHVSSNARCVYGRTSCRYRTLCDLEIRPLESANSRMHIPHTAWCSRCSQIPLDENGSSLCTLGSNDHVRPLHLSCLARCAHLDYRLGTINIIKEATRRHDKRVFFSNDLCAWRNGECLGNKIDTGVEVYNLTCCGSFIDNVLQCCGVIRNTVSYVSSWAQHGIIGILSESNWGRYLPVAPAERTLLNCESGKVSYWGFERV